MIYSVVAASLVFLALYRHVLTRPIDETEIGKDHPLAEKAELAQIAAAATKVNILQKTVKLE
jgi:hypothetical protein